jgi:ArsR family transcriptional regulator, arsenate/arsenite/antimonite-responsive transcriptional repressor
MKNIDNTVSILKALGDSTRFKILMHLLSSGNNLCVTALSGKLDVTQPVISQHLKVLKNAGLVNSSRMGYHIHYTVNTNKITEIANQLHDLIKTFPQKCINNNCLNKNK